MKSYPSLVRAKDAKKFTAHLFEKLDGQNFRVEFSTKKGWYKFGSRNQLIDENHQDFGIAVKLFNEKYGDLLTAVLKKNNYKEGVIFGELWGPRSLGGMHHPEDELDLTFFDFSPKGGIIAPAIFRKMFEGQVPTPKFLGIRNWGPALIEDVYNGAYGDGEGVVGKENSAICYMAKAKTKTWLEAISSRYGEEFRKKFGDE